MTGDGWHDPFYAQDSVHRIAAPAAPPVQVRVAGLHEDDGRTLIAGRDFTWTDAYEQRPVAMVSENLARELWSEPAAALGKHVRPIRTASGGKSSACSATCATTA